VLPESGCECKYRNISEKIMMVSVEKNWGQPHFGSR